MAGFNGASSSASNNEEGPHFQVPEVVVIGKKGYNYTSDEVYDALMFAFAKATKDMERQLERDWYAKGGQGNWFFGAGAALSGFAGAVQSEQMYTQGIRRGLSGNYALTGRNLSLFRDMPMTKVSMPISQLARWGGIAGRVSVGFGIAADSYMWYNGQISGAKFGVNTSVGVWGLTGVGTIPAIFYFGAESFVPGGFEGFMNGAEKGYSETRDVLGPRWRPVPLGGK